MRAGRRLVTIAAVLAVFGSVATSAPSTATAATPATSDVAAAVRAACTARAQPGPCRLDSTSSADLGGGVTEYTYVVRVGPQTYDRIALHRVVNGAVVRRAVFMIPGDLWGFDAAFAGDVGAAARVPNVAAYLARSGVDVWGLDMRWVLVPPRVAIADTGFMDSWGFTTTISDIRLGTTVERAVRDADLPGSGRTSLLGWSRGGQLAYAYAARETQLAPADRNVTALVPADTLAVYAPADVTYRRNECQTYRGNLRAIAAGFHAADLRDYLRDGRAALWAPDAESVPYPGYTNREVGLSYGGFIGFFTPWYHFLAETLDENGVWQSSRYTPETRFFGEMTRAAAYEPASLLTDGAAMWCGTVGSPFLDHLADVDVPLLYVAAAGGFGTIGSYSLTRVASTDLTTQLVRLEPVGDEVDDFGHVDLWDATDAQTLVWRPLAGWLKQH